MKRLNCDCDVGSGDYCEQCCDHQDIDYPECLDCGKDMSEELACRAYDYAKGMRQDADC